MAGKKIIENDSFSKFLIYKTPNNNIELEVFLHNENIWLTQKKIAELFDTTTQNITMHLKNIYGEKELEKEVTCKDFLQVKRSARQRLYIGF